jgi:hypothetical protein
LTSKLNDWNWRLNNLYYITDKSGKKIRFKTNAAQLELFKGMHYRNIILKARQLGFTTFKMIFMLDAALFNVNTRCGVIAHSKDDASRLFREKIKFAYDNLPEAIRKQMPASNDRAGEMVFANGSSITVGTSFRGGTLSYLHVSEFGKICAKYPERSKEIVTGAFESVGMECVITIESTAEGKQGYFYKYCTEAENAQKKGVSLTALDWKFFFFPWHLDPDYAMHDYSGEIPQRLVEYFERLQKENRITLSQAQKNWYATKEKTLGEDIKREYPSTPKEAFDQIIEGAYYAQQFGVLYERNQITRVPAEPSCLVHTFWDLGVNDTNVIWFIQQIGREYRVINYYENHGEGLPFYAKVLNDIATKEKYQYGLHVAPHDIAVRELGTGLTRVEQARRLGIKFEIAPKLSITDGIEAVRSVLLACWFDESKTEQGVNALQRYRKEWDDKYGVWKDKPCHDDASHPSDAFRTFAVAIRRLADKLDNNVSGSRYTYEEQSGAGFV